MKIIKGECGVRKKWLETQSKVECKEMLEDCQLTKKFRFKNSSRKSRATEEMAGQSIQEDLERVGVKKNGKRMQGDRSEILSQVDVGFQSC